MSQRPAYTPIAARCPNCSAPLTVPDERAQLVVCGSCDAHLSLEGPARDILKLVFCGSGKHHAYQLKLGQSFQHGGARYEVVARQHWIEDDSLVYSTRVYALYHPRRGLLFLDEYRGEWALMRKVHVMPTGQALAGRSVETFDGRTWICDEVVTRELIHVDGCLPWMCEVSDRVVAAECSAGDLRYEVERSELSDGQAEVEYYEGRALTPEELKVAMPGVSVVAHKPRPSLGVRKQRAVATLGAGFVSLMLQGMLFLVATFQGHGVLYQTFSASELTSEVMSKPFELRAGLVRVTLEASGLDDAWMAVDLALVQNNDTVRHVTDADLSYYSGYEGGEHWSEGSHQTSLQIMVPDPGTYTLYLHAVSGVGESETASKSTEGLQVLVTDGARSTFPSVVGVTVSLGMILVGLLFFKKLGED